ncbi:MAG: hypothetical protein ABUL42_02115 [Terricaulis silvestris]
MGVAQAQQRRLQVVARLVAAARWCRRQLKEAQTLKLRAHRNS